MDSVSLLRGQTSEAEGQQGDLSQALAANFAVVPSGYPISSRGVVPEGEGACKAVQVRVGKRETQISRVNTMWHYDNPADADKNYVQELDENNFTRSLMGIRLFLSSTALLNASTAGHLNHLQRIG